MHGQQASLNISARIEGYQSSLQQFRKAINQLDPGDQVRKSLERAFKNAQEYINKLAKTPIVNVNNENQINKVKLELQQAYNLINNISQGFSNLTVDNLNPSIIADATKGLRQLQVQAIATRDQLTQGLGLNTTAAQVSGLVDLFKKWGQNVNDLSTSQGLDILTNKIEQSRRASAALTQQLEKTKQHLRDLKAQPIEGLFGQKVNAKTRADVLETVDIKKNPINNVNFNTENFSKEAVANLKQTLESNLAQAPEALKNAFTKFFDESFNAGVNNLNLESTIKEFVRKISEELQNTVGAQQLTIKQIFGNLFGSNSRGNPIGDAGQAFTKVAEGLRNITLQSSDASTNLKLVVDTLATAGVISERQKIKLFEDIDANKLKETQAALSNIVEQQKEIYNQRQQSIAALQKETRSLASKKGIQNRRTTQLENFSQALKNTQEWKDAQEQIDKLNGKIAQLQKQIQAAGIALVKGTQQMVSGASQAANSYRLTTQEVKKLQQQANRLKDTNALVGKIQGVLTRWFSIYAVINKVSQAIKSMISTVQQLDKTITNIAIVTNMSQNDLWNQMPTYTKVAREYAASISGVYEVSQLYYQQGELNI